MLCALIDEERRLLTSGGLHRKPPRPQLAGTVSRSHACAHAHTHAPTHTSTHPEAQVQQHTHAGAHAVYQHHPAPARRSRSIPSSTSSSQIEAHVSRSNCNSNCNSSGAPCCTPVSPPLSDKATLSPPLTVSLCPLYLVSPLSTLSLRGVATTQRPATRPSTRPAPSTCSWVASRTPTMSGSQVCLTYTIHPLCSPASPSPPLPPSSPSLSLPPSPCARTTLRLILLARSLALGLWRPEAPVLLTRMLS